MEGEVGERALVVVGAGDARRVEHVRDAVRAQLLEVARHHIAAQVDLLRVRVRGGGRARVRVSPNPNPNLNPNPNPNPNLRRELAADGREVTELLRTAVALVQGVGALLPRLIQGVGTARAWLGVAGHGWARRVHGAGVAGHGACTGMGECSGHARPCSASSTF